MFTALWRGFPRIMTIAAIGAFFLFLQEFYPLLLGPILTPTFLGLGLTFLAYAVGDALVRIAQPKVDAQAAALDALKNGDIAAGIVYLARNLLVAIVLLLVVTAPRAEGAGLLKPVPANALALLPIVKQEQMVHWPDMPIPSLFGAQIHKESCITERHSRCWTTRAELKTSRERGLGLGQFTIAWNKAGRVRFDALTELVQNHPRQLAGVDWKVYERDARVQIRAVVLKDYQSYRFMQRLGFQPGEDVLKAMASGYNGGDGAVRSDQAVCRGTRGCDPTRWDGHVATTSLKQKTAVPGYGKPFFQINREYADRLVDPKPLRERYVPHLEA